tara:strand:- start:79 stop:906 length:828 start_codon:yes stop_codon:yes gene_type:complete
MKLRHNKKRNTAFLYETLVKELTKSIVNNDTRKKNIVLSILKEHFKKGSVLGNELSLYKDVVESRELDYNIAEKILHEAKMIYWSGFKNQKVYDEQSEVITKVNKDLSKNTFSNFVPNYKDLATLAQIFNDNLTVKKRVMLEKQIITNMISKDEKSKKVMKPIDKLTFKTFTNKFNSAYGELQENQKELLMQYIYSFSDDGLGLKVYLNEEIKELKKSVEESLELEEVQSDPIMVESTKKVIGMIEEYKSKKIDETMISQVLNIQKLVKEIQSDG